MSKRPALSTADHAVLRQRLTEHLLKNALVALIATSGLRIAPLGAHVLRRFHLAQDKSS